MTYCANVDAGRISRSNSLNMANIRLIRARNPSRPHVRSLRSPFSDSLLVLPFTHKPQQHNKGLFILYQGVADTHVLHCSIALP